MTKKKVARRATEQDSWTTLRNVRTIQLRRLRWALDRGDVAEAVVAFRWAVAFTTQPGAHPNWKPLNEMLWAAYEEAKDQQRAPTAPPADVIALDAWKRTHGGE